MYKHIVSWEFSDANKLQNIAEMKALLETLPALIPEIEGYEVGINVSNSPLAMDMVLISSFMDENAYKIYAKHPEHAEVVNALHSVTSNAVIVDYNL